MNEFNKEFECLGLEVLKLDSIAGELTGLSHALEVLRKMRQQCLGKGPAKGLAGCRGHSDFDGGTSKTTSMSACSTLFVNVA